jgi:large subunit ribosomal protein L31
VPGGAGELTTHRRATDIRGEGGPEAAAKLERDMKTGVHPEYVEAHVRCTCGNEFMTRSTKPEIHVEICSACHPFYTGRQKLVDTGGRVERFQRRVAKGRRAARASAGA